jgi:hypothetical protein
MPATEPLDKPTAASRKPTAASRVSDTAASRISGTAASRASGKVSLDDIAWEFLGSEFTGMIYADWPLDRRLDVFLRHHGYRTLHDDGSAYSELLERVMENISVAVRNGVLPPLNGAGAS